MTEHKLHSTISSLELPLVPETGRSVPFFSRLGVKHGIIMAAFILMAMSLITVQQLRDTLREIELHAEEKGRAVAAAVAPLVLPALRTGNPEALKHYFDIIASGKNIEYVQVVDASGNAEVANNLVQGRRAPSRLNLGWIHFLNDQERLDRRAVPVPWKNGHSGVDVFVVLLEQPESAKLEDVLGAKHLRIGVNFDNVILEDTPRVIWRMVLFSLGVTAVMVGGLVVLLGYILRPLRELHIGLNAVAAGNLNYQMPVFSRDEVGRVVQSFNATILRLRTAFEQIEELATRDPLTNLPNRRSFDDRISIEAARSRRYGHPFGLIMMDLDHFKVINDTYGHPAGDEVLKYVAKLIEANVRETDLPSRIGGEEFAVILPETRFDEVQAVAEKLRAAVCQCDMPSKQGVPDGIRISLSAGAACSAGHLVTPESMIAAADAALLKSKREGRNRITLAPPMAGKTSIMRRVSDDSGRAKKD